MSEYTLRSDKVAEIARREERERAERADRAAEARRRRDKEIERLRDKKPLTVTEPHTNFNPEGLHPFSGSGGKVNPPPREKLVEVIENPPPKLSRPPVKP
ncbi:MAG: hypothetical protein HYW62_01665 [Candidatus Levybacteria bacterium]|nr:hypothetical protein [Candidatus Levybacteria bacterium]